MKKSIVSIFCLIIGIIIGLFFDSVISCKKKNSYFKLMEDAHVGEMGSLKKGTLIKYDDSYPEGFTRFVLYLNADDIDLKKVEGVKRNEIIPYWLEKKFVD